MDIAEFKAERARLKETYGRELAEGFKSAEYLKAAQPCIRYSKLREDRFSSILLGDWLKDNPEWRPT